MNVEYVTKVTDLPFFKKYIYINRNTNGGIFRCIFKRYIRNV